MNRRNLIRIAILVAAAALFGYRHWQQGSQKPKHATMAPIASDASAFTLGTLSFKGCELDQPHSGATTSAFCAPFQVPENWDAPDGRRIDLRLALIRSEAEAADSDLVVFLAGGPGQSAIDNWPRIASAFGPLRAHHHVLLLDQRGTGKSHALVCRSEKKDDAPPAAGAVQPAQALEEVREDTRRCLAEVEKDADPRQYTTTAATRDLEAVRQALGAPQFDLVGVSYGTRMAQQYLMRHPDGVRSLVLDSVAPNEVVLGQDFAENLENSLKAHFSLCTQLPACAKAFPDPYASLIRLRDELRARPQDYDFRDPVTFEPAHKRLDDYALAGLVRLFAYTPETAALLPLSIAEGLKGNYAPLAGQSQLLTGDLSELRDNGMQTSVICTEDADLLTPRPQDAETVLGTALIDVIRTQCEVWPHTAGGFPHAAEVGQTGIHPRRRTRPGNAAALRRAAARGPEQCAAAGREGSGTQRDRPRLHSTAGRGLRRSSVAEGSRYALRRRARPDAGVHRLQRFVSVTAHTRRLTRGERTD
jgi:pimeloyl-ACP methyl ester carboxylesterase